MRALMLAVVLACSGAKAKAPEPSEPGTVPGDAVLFSGAFVEASRGPQ